jgi:hypothetical protein
MLLNGNRLMTVPCQSRTAERRRWHSRAERGNEEESPPVPELEISIAVAV